MVYCSLYGSSPLKFTNYIFYIYLSTYMVIPVTARARGESKKAAVAPTSSEYRSCAIGALACEYWRNVESIIMTTVCS